MSDKAALIARVQQYAWMLPVGAPVAWVMAWGMGANELSSNWGNVFGSRVLKLWQIVLLAAIFEFTGAMALGNGVASTIRGSILSSSEYASAPEQLMFGFLVVLVTCSIWLFIANYLGLPISDSQTTVLSLIGVGLASRGWSSVRWDPGMVNIGISWAVSPFSAAIIGAVFFFLVRKFVLTAPNATDRAKRLFPFFVFFVLGINIFFFMFETPLLEDSLEPWLMVVIAISASLFLTVVAYFTYFRWIVKKIAEAENAAANQIEAQVPESTALKGDEDGTVVLSATVNGQEKTTAFNSVVPTVSKVDTFLASNKTTSFLVEDVQGQTIASNKRLTEVHAAADKYPIGVELLFTHLLIITACFKSFAHGASDVSNATGPLAAILNILEDGKIDSRSPIPLWTLAVGATGMAVGILTYGYRTLATLGVKLTRISPVRGVCIDLSSAIVVIGATYLKVPISSTQVTVGSIIGVALATGTAWNEKIHVSNFLIIIIGWLVTLVFSSLVSFSLYSFAVRAPKV
ncbi:phosphate transporter [Cladochytrium replicatum]|nr:phosphate transporter [Cladochytrium replicatum]